MSTSATVVSAMPAGGDHPRAGTARHSHPPATAPTGTATSIRSSTSAAPSWSPGVVVSRANSGTSTSVATSATPTSRLTSSAPHAPRGRRSRSGSTGERARRSRTTKATAATAASGSSTGPSATTSVRVSAAANAHTSDAEGDHDQRRAEHVDLGGQPAQPAQRQHRAGRVHQAADHQRQPGDHRDQHQRRRGRHRIDHRQVQDAEGDVVGERGRCAQLQPEREQRDRAEDQPHRVGPAHPAR